jgi:hypothetical protein
MMGGACNMHREMGNVYKILDRQPEGKRPLRRLGKDGRIILNFILGKLCLVVWIAFIWLRIGTNGRLL